MSDKEWKWAGQIVRRVLKLVSVSKFFLGPSVESFLRTGITRVEALGEGKVATGGDSAHCTS